MHEESKAKKKQNCKAMKTVEKWVVENCVTTKEFEYYKSSPNCSIETHVLDQDNYNGKAVIKIIINYIAIF